MAPRGSALPACLLGLLLLLGCCGGKGVGRPAVPAAGTVAAFCPSVGSSPPPSVSGAQPVLHAPLRDPPPLPAPSPSAATAAPAPSGARWAERGRAPPGVSSVCGMEGRDCGAEISGLPEGTNARRLVGGRPHWVLRPPEAAAAGVGPSGALAAVRAAGPAARRSEPRSAVLCFPGSVCSPCTAQPAGAELPARRTGWFPADTTRGSRCAAMLRSGAAVQWDAPCLSCPPFAQQSREAKREPLETARCGQTEGSVREMGSDAGRSEMGCGLFPAQTSPRGSQRFVLGNGSNLRGVRGDGCRRSAGVPGAQQCVGLVANVPPLEGRKGENH